MHENRTKYPKKKTQMYQVLQELPKKYSVTALVRMEKVRASQLLPLRKKLQGEVEIVSIKDRVAKKALEKLDVPGMDKMSEKLTGQCVFMFTNMSPFKLNVLLGKKQGFPHSKRWRYCKHGCYRSSKKYRNSSWSNAY